MTAAEKQTVIQREGHDWAFHLPGGHEAEVDESGSFVTLSMPGAGGSYRVTRIYDDDPEEQRIVVGGVFVGEHGLRADPELPDSVGYSFPLVRRGDSETPGALSAGGRASDGCEPLGEGRDIRLANEAAAERDLSASSGLTRFLADPLADLEPLGIVERNGHGWQLTSTAERRFGRELRLFAGSCAEYEARGVPREHTVVFVLHAAAERVRVDSP